MNSTINHSPGFFSQKQIIKVNKAKHYFKIIPEIYDKKFKIFPQEIEFKKGQKEASFILSTT